MYHALTDLAKTLLHLGLEDDGWQWDWTTIGSLGVTDQKRIIRADILAKDQGIWAGGPLIGACRGLSAELGGPIDIEAFFDDGAVVAPEQRVARWEGPARTLLALERPFLNLASYVCGIATRTRAMTEAIAQGTRDWKVPPPRLAATRKTLPGYRDFALHGVIAGGGFPHRVSLSGGVLIKENHIAAAGGIVRAIEGSRAAAPHGLKIEVEVTSLEELRLALSAGADGVLLDNFTPEQVAAALIEIERAANKTFVEVSGGISGENLARYLQPGVHVLSSGGLTHSVRALDLSLLVEGWGSTSAVKP
jgi:nicotinate-nucleotide pyrophosphorylase (carboxylating)